VIYGARDLDEAAALVRERLGLTAVAGGQHDGQGTHNRIVPFGDGSYLELIAVSDPERAARSPVGSLVQARIALGDGLIGWAAAVQSVDAVAARLGTSVVVVERDGLTARLTAVAEALAEPALPFFIERSGQHRPVAPERAPGGITWIEVAGDARRVRDWLGGEELSIRVVDGSPAVLAVGIDDHELRTM
jgi:hypothetical protein